MDGVDGHNLSSAKHSNQQGFHYFEIFLKVFYKFTQAAHVTTCRNQTQLERDMACFTNTLRQPA
jgi:hypothetical protein